LIKREKVLKQQRNNTHNRPTMQKERVKPTSYGLVAGNDLKRN